MRQQFRSGDHVQWTRRTGERGQGLRRARRWCAPLLVLGLVMAGLIAGGAAAPRAAAEPNSLANYVTTLRCDSANPWPGPRVPVWVDVYNQIPFPSDGLPGPAIALIGSSRSKTGLFEYTTEVRVSWRNLRTGRTGAVTVPGRARYVTWQAVLHPGKGLVAFTIRQKLGAVAFVPMVNPQYATCQGRAVA